MVGLAEIDWNAIISPTNIPIFAVAMVAVVSVAGIVSGCWLKAKQHESDARIKREMIAKGYSADEIERVIATKPPRHGS